jgi:signal transduction histidine kinase
MSSIDEVVDRGMPARARDALPPAKAIQIAERLMQRLHDGPTQLLALALLRLDCALLCTDAAHEPLLGNVRALVCEALRDTRHMLEEWHEDAADQPVALAASLKALGRRLGALTGQSLRVDCDTPADPPAPVAAVMLQAAQELLVNSCKHAPGAQVELTLTVVHGRFELTVCDDGPGFDPLAIHRHHAATGLGLSAMPERLARVGAALSVQSHPGEGVRACIRWPDLAAGVLARSTVR